MNKYKILKASDFHTSLWSGGSTTQLAIFPANANYADQDFLWRLSSATVEVESSVFTSLENYDRMISVIEGEMILSHNDGKEISVSPFQIHAFDGGIKTTCKGKCRDFNLMIRKNLCGAFVQSISFKGQYNVSLHNQISSERYHDKFMIVYSANSNVTICYREEDIRLAENMVAIFDNPSEEEMILKSEDNTPSNLFFLYIFIH